MKVYVKDNKQPKTRDWTVYITMYPKAKGSEKYGCVYETAEQGLAYLSALNIKDGFVVPVTLTIEED